VSLPATVRDVAREARVSTATVSRVLNGDPRVSPATAERVREAIALLGYSVNRAARSLKTSATRSIGVIAPDLGTEFFMLLADRLELELASRGYSMLIASSRESAAEEERLLGLFSARLVDGIVAIPATAEGGHFRRAIAAGIPLVLVDRAPEGAMADSVLVDNEGGAREATIALAGLGHRRLGFLGGEPGVTTARERHEGFRRALAELGIAPEPAFESFGPAHIESGYRRLGALLARPGAPEAWFIVNADTHIGATNWLYTEGKAFRDRLAFAAFDEMPYSPLLPFCRFAVEQPVAEMGKVAAGLILERVAGEGGPEPRLVRLPTRLIPH
jgi:LacI family transcriptional regulator